MNSTYYPNATTIYKFWLANGLFGCCPYCGDVRVVRFSREVA